MKRALTFLLCLALALTAWGCTDREQASPDLFYYPRAETAFRGSDGVLAPEERDLKDIGTDLGAVLELYCAGPISPELDDPLPPGAVVEEYSLENGVLTLRFSPELAQLSGVELTVAVGCLARTFLERTGAQTLVLTAGGALLNGDTALHLTLEDLGLRDTSPDRLHKNLTVYYAAADRRYLIGQEVTLHLSSPEELPRQLLELLLTPPAGSGLRSALPENTRILSASVDDGLCTVELSTEFDSRRFYALPAQRLSLMSVVNTLTALEEIDRVEFVIDGNLLIRYGTLSITEPLVRDERCIGPVRTGLGEQDGTVYLVHGDEGRLFPVPVRLRRSASVSRAELVMQQLLQDPGVNGLRTCISPGTRLNSVSVSDGVCRVDLSPELLAEPEQLSAACRVIAASLCQLEEVEEVCILVDGAVPAGFDSAWFGPLCPNEDWFL